MEFLLRKISLLIFLIITVCFNAFEAHALVCPNQKWCHGQIDYIDTFPGGTQVYIVLKGGLTGATCTPIGDVGIVLDSAEPLFREAYATVTAAVISGQGVTIRVPETGTCEVLWVRLCSDSICP